MSDFNLETSRWWNFMKVTQAARHIKTDAATVIDRSRILANFEYDPVAGKELADAETSLTEALLAVKLARQEYEQNAGRMLQAAE